jgi:cytochrome c
MAGVLTLGRSLAAGALAGLLLAAAPADAADVAHGKAVASQMCAMCHSLAKGGAPILGPTLYGVVGRKAGSLPGYGYSDAIKQAGFAWTPDRLRAFLPGPAKAVPGTKMTFAGLKNPAQVEDVIAYLSTLR